VPVGRHRLAAEAASRQVAEIQRMHQDFLTEMFSAIRLTNEALGDADVESAINVHQAMYALEHTLMGVIGEKLAVWENELARYRAEF
jgi:hypothetical protein